MFYNVTDMEYTQNMQLRIPKILLEDARVIAEDRGVTQAEALRMGLALGLVRLRPLHSARQDTSQGHRNLMRKGEVENDRAS